MRKKYKLALACTQIIPTDCPPLIACTGITLRDLRFLRRVLEAVALLGCYAAYVCRWLPMFRDSLSAPSWRVKHSKNNCFPVEGGTDWLSINAVYQLLLMLCEGFRGKFTIYTRTQTAGSPVW